MGYIFLKDFLEFYYRKYTNTRFSFFSHPTLSAARIKSEPNGEPNKPEPKAIVGKPKVVVASKQKIPLHAGSTVFVFKQQLIDIYVPHLDVYVARLAELVFGRLTLQSLQWNSLGGMDETKLRALISKFW